MWQDNFAEGLRPETSLTPSCLKYPGGRTVDRRFKVYRNNIYSSLAANLADGYPVVLRLVGDEFFQGMAREYVKTHLPDSPVMVFYGQSFGDFIDSFAPANSVPYLGDIARLEYARRIALHAADDVSLTRNQLSTIPIESLLGASLVMHPSVQMISSAFPIYAIWGRTTEKSVVTIPAHGESVLVSRLGSRVTLSLLPDGAAEFLEMIKAGQTIGAASEHALVSGHQENLDEFIRIALENATALKLAPDS